MNEQNLGLMHFWEAGDAVTHSVAYMLLVMSVLGPGAGTPPTARQAAYQPELPVSETLFQAFEIQEPESSRGARPSDCSSA